MMTTIYWICYVLESLKVFHLRAFTVYKKNNMDLCVISILKRGKTSLEKLNKISNLRKTNMNLRLLNFKIHAREL